MSVVLLALAVASVTAADAPSGAWLRGCWEPVAGAAAIPAEDGAAFCVSMPTGSSVIETLTIVADAVESRDRLIADGVRRPFEQGECRGRQSARWSEDGARLYFESQFECAGQPEETSTEILTITRRGLGLRVTGRTEGTETAVRTARYRRRGLPRLPEEVQADLELVPGAERVAVPGAKEIAEAARQVAPGVVEAWLAGAGWPFRVDGRQLLAFRDAGVPDRVIDLLVALSYPERFAVDETSRPTRPSAAAGSTWVGGGPVWTPVGSWVWGPAELFVPWAAAYHMYPYPLWDPGNTYRQVVPTDWYATTEPLPLVLVPVSHGRVVWGTGYVDGAGSATAVKVPDGNASSGVTATASQPSSAGTVSTSSGASSSSSVSASGGYSNGSTDSGGGTAHPR